MFGSAHILVPVPWKKSNWRNSYIKKFVYAFKLCTKNELWLTDRIRFFSDISISDDQQIQILQAKVFTPFFCWNSGSSFGSTWNQTASCHSFQISKLQTFQSYLFKLTGIEYLILKRHISVKYSLKSSPQVALLSAYLCAAMLCIETVFYS